MPKLTDTGPAMSEKPEQPIAVESAVWQTDAEVEICYCIDKLPVYTNGRKSWAYCPACHTLKFIEEK
jgi:hypothetical protein